MEIILVVLGFILCVIGIIGSVVPGLPGHPLNFGALLIAQAVFAPFSTSLLVWMGVLTGLFMVLDYLIPIWTAKRYGTTRQGVVGSIVGMFVGMFLTPIGMILGTLIGAVVGDLLAGKSLEEAGKSGFATVFGTLVSIGFKVVLAGVMTWLFLWNTLPYLWAKL